MGIFIHVIVGSICGAITAAIASHKGRNALGWFFAGFFLGIIGIVIVAVQSNLTLAQERRARARRERSRLREQIKQEKVKGEAFRRYTAARLDAHDGALGMDTRSPQALPSGEPAGYLEGGGAGNASSSASSPSTKRQWYYEVGGERKGPVSEGRLKGMFRRGYLEGDTLVWSEDLDDWQSAVDVPSFRSELGL